VAADSPQRCQRSARKAAQKSCRRSRRWTEMEALLWAAALRLLIRSGRRFLRAKLKNKHPQVSGSGASEKRASRETQSEVTWSALVCVCCGRDCVALSLAVGARPQRPRLSPMNYGRASKCLLCLSHCLSVWLCVFLCAHSSAHSVVRQRVSVARLAQRHSLLARERPPSGNNKSNSLLLFANLVS